MVRVLAAAFDGQGTVGLAMPKRFDVIARASQYISPRLRSRLFSLGAANEAVRVENLSRGDGPLAVRWVTSQYESRKRTNSIFIGAANGAVTDLAAGLGAPYLQQTLLLLVRRQVDPDDIDAVITHGQQISGKLAASFPDVAIHQMHDPLNDRGNAAQAAYLRLKWRRLPEGYREFIRSRLTPGGRFLSRAAITTGPPASSGRTIFSSWVGMERLPQKTFLNASAIRPAKTGNLDLRQSGDTKMP